jgi:uncharacterized protein YuzE
MKITIGTYATYIQIRPTKKGEVAHTREIAPETYADYDEDGVLLGIEYVGAVKPDVE